MKNFEYKGAKSPVADLQLGGLYETAQGTTWDKTTLTKAAKSAMYTVRSNIIYTI